MTDLTEILLQLADGGVDFVLVGGLAAVSQGAPVTTFDVDIVHDRTRENVARLLTVLERLRARYRGRPDELRPTADALCGPGHHLLTTTLGPLDVLGAVEDGLVFADLVRESLRLEVDGRRLRVLRLEKLLELKRRWSDAESRLRADILARTLAAKEGGHS